MILKPKGMYTLEANHFKSMLNTLMQNTGKHNAFRDMDLFLFFWIWAKLLWEDITLDVLVT
jgi:hypothetical protein